MLSDDDDDEVNDNDDVSIQTLSLLEKILHEREQVKLKNKTSRLTSPSSSNVSTPVKGKNGSLALTERQEIQYEKVFELIDKKKKQSLKILIL